MQRHREKGFTLIELLVATAVTGLSIAMLLPAVQLARGAARRASCINNLKQIGLATRNYAQVWGSLPMSMALGEGHGNGQSVFMAILPFLEEVRIYNGYNFHVENWHQVNHTAIGTSLNVYLCPDNPTTNKVDGSEVRYPEPKAVFAMGHYGANWGGGRTGWNLGTSSYRRLPPKGGSRGPWGEDFMKARGAYLGVIMTLSTPDGQAKAKDGKPLARVVSETEIPDGLAFTLGFVEKRDSFGWAVGGWGGSEFDVHTGPGYEGDDPLARKVYSGSPHAQGPNATMCDGSVRTLSPKQDRKMWYALITRAGGEVVKFDEK